MRRGSLPVTAASSCARRDGVIERRSRKPVLGLRHDLLRDHEHIEARERRIDRPKALRQQRGEVIAGTDLG